MFPRKATIELDRANDSNKNLTDQVESQNTQINKLRNDLDKTSKILDKTLAENRRLSLPPVFDRVRFSSTSTPYREREMTTYGQINSVTGTQIRESEEESEEDPLGFGLFDHSPINPAVHTTLTTILNSTPTNNTNPVDNSRVQTSSINTSPFRQPTDPLINNSVTQGGYEDNPSRGSVESTITYTQTNPTDQTPRTVTFISAEQQRHLADHIYTPLLSTKLLNHPLGQSTYNGNFYNQ